MIPVFDVSISRKNHHRREVNLMMPATPYEIQDALERLRVSSAEEVKAEILYSQRSKYLNLLPVELGGLYEVNALAEKMSSFEDWQQEAFDGLVKADAFKSDRPIPISRLIDFAYSTECCHVLGGITTDRELGEFLVDNGLWANTEEMPEETFAKLDYTAIGREERLDNGGVFTDNSYVEQHSELVEAHKTLDYIPKALDYTILLEIRTSGFDGETSVMIKLPTSSESLNKVLDQLGVDIRQETSFECADCKVPLLKDPINNAEDIREVNRLASILTEMPQKQMTEYKAIVAAVKPNDFDSAVHLIERMDEYLVTPQYETLENVARDELNVFVDPQSAEAMIPYLDLEGYGRALVKTLNADLTEYGMVERKDRQPVCAPQEKPGQEQFNGINL